VLAVALSDLRPTWSAHALAQCGGLTRRAIERWHDDRSPGRALAGGDSPLSTAVTGAQIAESGVQAVRPRSRSRAFRTTIKGFRHREVEQ
jgi:hypothetical protein